MIRGQSKIFDKKYDKKAISPVVATSLLLILSVIAVVSFQNWYSGFESGILTNTEQKSSSSTGIDIEFISSEGIIYITNSGNSNISLSTIKIGLRDCNLTLNLTPGVNRINIASCLNKTGINEVIIMTQEGIIQEKLFVEEIPPSCILNSVIKSQGQSYNFYNSSFVFFGNSCSYISRSCDDGFFLGDSNFNQSSCNILSSSLTCITDSDLDGFISYLCGSYPMLNSTYEGDFDVNDDNSTIIPDPSCVWRNDKSDCLNNYIIDGCGSETVLDIGSGLCWDRKFSRAGTYTWANALIYCDTLNTHPSGHNDWYLPSNQELQTIVDASRSAPTIAGGDNVKFQNVVSSFYWSRTVYAPNSINAHTSDFSRGSSTSRDRATVQYVVCIRRS